MAMCDDATGKSSIAPIAPQAVGDEHTTEAPDPLPPITCDVCGALIVYGAGSPSPHRTPIDHNLTNKELTLLRHLADGHSYGSAARNMSVSVNTVRNYIRSIYVKLHVHSKSEAVSKVIKWGLF